MLLRLQSIASSITFQQFRENVFHLPSGVTLITLWIENATAMQSFRIAGEAWVTQLQFMDTSLDRIPATIGYLRSLNSFSLTRSKLKNLQLDAVFRMPELRIDLSYNRVWKMESTSQLALSSIESLIMMRNNLTKLPWEESFQLPDLRVLLLDENDFTQMPNSWGELPKLTTLSLQKNQLKVLSMSAFRSLAELKSILLSYNQLEVVNSVGPVVVLPQLSVLSFLYNNITQIDLSGCQFPILSILTLSNNLFQRIPRQIFSLNPTISLKMYENPLRCANVRQFRNEIVANRLRITSADGQPSNACSKQSIYIQEMNKTMCCVG
ncbi:leucine-rich repeat protein soc-2-like [Anopheles nili]|uniref:leucine-rich repeat protein soc-2-like n=1 Tax=Anopheles nili TaxID=185578 RepID=UPI00237B2B2D|nr:leucine-rich repeat protein soc-2-like [Anopheles nili]